MTSPADIITAVGSGWAPAPRALIRLSGRGVLDLARSLLTDVPDRSHACTQSSFRLDTERLVSCIAMRFDAPRTYTGEDIIELAFPGNPRLLERIVARICAYPGVREAGPGEFSARAFLNARLTIAQAEGIAALIAARNDDELEAAKRLMSGATGDQYRVWADEAATLLALVEAGIDFTDQEDVVPIAPAALAHRLRSLAQGLSTHLGARSGSEHLAATPRVVLAGNPNAGKSTLFNRLLGRARALESPVAGTTRDAIAEPLDLSRDVASGPLVTLIDLAGLDDAPLDAPIDSAAQDQARAEITRADILLHCDPTGRFLPLTEISPHAAVIRVRTKADLPQTTTAPAASGTFAVCALDGWNLLALRHAIADAAWTSRPKSSACALPRHRRVLALTNDAVAAALSAVDPSAHALASPEVVAGHLRAAMDLLGELVGEISPDDIIGRIFATFCVGK